MMPLSLPNREMPVDFQQKDASLCLHTLRAGEPCHFVGLGSVGKSNFLRHIIRPEVKHFHLKTSDDQSHEKLVTVLIDPHSLLSPQGNALEHVGRLWSGYEIMLSRLYRSMWRLEMKGRASSDKTELIAKLNDRYDRLSHRDAITAQSGLRSLERSVYEIINADKDYQIAFVLDDMETFRRKLPDDFFETLRGLRDDYKGKVMYLATARNDMEAVMHVPGSDENMIEAFVELFHDHTFYISLLNKEEVNCVVESLIERNRFERMITGVGQEQLVTRLYELTGGHAGLVRRCFKPAIRYFAAALRNSQLVESDNLRDYLLRDSGVNKECAILVKSFAPGERSVLSILLQDQTVPEDSPDFPYQQKLLDKHILNEAGNDFTMPLLKWFIWGHPDVLN